ncbi:Sir2 family NAD-dependent protein deacetylase [Sediminibacterium sp.]|uniref:SIR2 family NAD-dependent protein deacylase n=1 Tax=Sediminibacterium sp. TaxID=1917865 RepID=UPI0027349105|nr:Sir2 family NAD-dependent protein deacetylase [Sediminibacterium sp.]MDP3394592.1 Sir2 family NAD-dependent protein deacetylase [Sediminibacterium sp.]MDP3568427.1 Sir2 family NAD-dependent protein deacetylase [Sediminibacterium sp.]
MKNTVVITGAGVSVESGIQPFRGKNGIWNENPTEMATYQNFRTNTGSFLQWYYHRFVSCKDALPNKAHKILATKNIKVITQNIDNLHIKAKHPLENLIEIHGNINYKRRIHAQYREELALANWDTVDENNLEQELFELFHIHSNGSIDENKSERPHILLFDEYYTELYQYEEAHQWMDEADTIIFMGTSNSVGFTYGALQMAINNGKKTMVVDPNPAPSFNHPSVEIIRETATDFCSSFF